MDKSEVVQVIVGVDIIGVVLFLLAVCWMRACVQLEELQSTGGFLSARDYTIKVENLPCDVTEWELRAHFSELARAEGHHARETRALHEAQAKNAMCCCCCPPAEPPEVPPGPEDEGKVAEVFLAEDCEELFEVCMLRGSGIKKLGQCWADVDARLRDLEKDAGAEEGKLPRSVQQADARLQELIRARDAQQQKVRELTDRAKAVRAKSGVLAAFVTFERAEDAARVLRVYGNGDTARWCCLPWDLRLQRAGDIGPERLARAKADAAGARVRRAARSIASLYQACAHLKAPDGRPRSGGAVGVEEWVEDGGAGADLMLLSEDQAEAADSATADVDGAEGVLGGSTQLDGVQEGSPAPSPELQSSGSASVRIEPRDPAATSRPGVDIEQPNSEGQEAGSGASAPEDSSNSNGGANLAASARGAASTVPPAAGTTDGASASIAPAAGHRRESITGLIHQKQSSSHPQPQAGSPASGDSSGSFLTSTVPAAILVSRASEPSTIQWQNLGYSPCMRCLLQSFTSMIAVLLVLVCSALTFWASIAQEQAQSEGGERDCPVDSETGEPISVSKQAAEEDPEMLHCYCRQISPRQVLSNPEQKALCEAWLGAQSLALTIVVLAALATVLVNGALELCLWKLAKLERHHSLEARSLSFGSRLTLFQIINTAYIATLVNAYIPGLDWGGLGLKDLSPTWYSEVGTQMVISLFVQILVMHVWDWSGFCCTMCCARSSWSVNKALQRSQREVDALYTGSGFKFETRYAELINITYVCLAFSAGMPIMHVVAATAFFVTFWSDKILFLRFFRTPPFQDGTLHKHLTSWLPLALLTHLAVGAWQLSNSTIFSSDDWVERQFGQQLRLADGQDSAREGA